MAQFDQSSEDLDDDEKLAQDYETPFSEPLDARGEIPPDHQITDSNIDSDQLYHEGLASASEANENEEETL